MCDFLPTARRAAQHWETVSASFPTATVINQLIYMVFAISGTVCALSAGQGCSTSAVSKIGGTQDDAYNGPTRVDGQFLLTAATAANAGPGFDDDQDIVVLRDVPARLPASPES